MASSSDNMEKCKDDMIEIIKKLQYISWRNAPINIIRYKQSINYSLMESEKNDFKVLLLCCCLYIRDKFDGLKNKKLGQTICNSIFDINETKYELQVAFYTKYFNIGCWGDMKHISLNNANIQVIVDQLKKDYAIVEEIEANDLVEKGIDYRISTCAKWCPLPRSKSKNTNIALLIATTLFPQIKEDSWYYGKKDDGTLDKSKKLSLKYKKGIPSYVKHRTLFRTYQNYIRRIRNHLEYVEKYMHQDKFDQITPEMLTINNKTKMQNALLNRKPIYYKSKKYKDISKNKKKHGKYKTDVRSDNDDRKELASRLSATIENFWKKKETPQDKEDLDFLNSMVSTPANIEFLESILPHINHSLLNVQMVIEI